MEFKYTEPSGEFEESPGVKKNVTTSVKMEDVDASEVYKHLQRFERGGYEKVTVSVALKLPKE